MPESQAIPTPSTPTGRPRPSSLGLQRSPGPTGGQRTEVEPPPQVVALLSSKGGVGKTSLCANVAAQAALLIRPERVLGVDLDPSGDLALDLGYRGEPADDQGAALAEALLRGTAPRPAPTRRSDVDVLAGGARLHFAATVTASLASDGVGALADALGCLAGRYGVAVVDCPPGLGAMTHLALAAADGVVIPIRADDASLAAIGALAALWRDIRTHHNAHLALLGVALMQVPGEERRFETQLRDDVRAIGQGHLRVFQTAVRANPEAAWGTRRLGLTADEYADHAENGERARTARGLADDYRHLTAEILSRLRAHHTATTNRSRP